MSKQLKGISSDVKISHTRNLNEVKEIPQAIEQQATNRIEAMDELQNQSELFDSYKEQLGAGGMEAWY